MVFDSDAGGGVRMSSESVTRRALLERILADARFGETRERCAFLREMIPRNLDAAEYASLGGGACAAFPVEERAAMADDQGVIGVDCAFCSRLFPVSLDSFVQG